MQEMWDKTIRIVKKRIKELREESDMWWELRKTTKPDCRTSLFWEFLMNPRKLRQRYEDEQQFQRNMNSRWKS